MGRKRRREGGREGRREGGREKRVAVGHGIIYGNVALSLERTCIATPIGNIPELPHPRHIVSVQNGVPLEGFHSHQR